MPSSVDFNVIDGQAPYPGPSAPATSSGTLTIDASNFDEGGQGVSYFDATSGITGGSATDGGRIGSDVEQTSAGDIGWVRDGEWLEYTINITEAGTYDLDALMGTRNSGRGFEVTFCMDGEDTPYATTGRVDTTNTGSYSSFTDNSATGLSLQAGVQVMRITFSGNDQDLRSLTLTATEADPDPDPDPIPDPEPDPGPGPGSDPDPVQTPYPGPNAPTLVADGSLTIDASNYDEGGQGISYFDTTSGIVGSSNATDGGRTGSDVDQTIYGDIGWVRDGEWLEYTINITEAGTFDLDVLMGTRNSGRGFTVEFYRDGETSAYASTGAIDTINTGSYRTFTENSATGLALEAGIQTVRITFNGNDQDFRGFTLTTDTSDPDPDPDPIPDPDPLPDPDPIPDPDPEPDPIPDPDPLPDPDPIPDPDPEPDPVQTPYPGPSAPTLAADGSLTIDASNYDEGGQGISYFDTTSGIVGSSNASDGGRTGSDVDQTIYGDIGWVRDGEWLEYTINIAEAGTFDLDVLMGTRNSGRGFTVEFYRDGETSAYASTGRIDTINTGSYRTFVENSATGLALEAGVQTVRITFNGNDQDFRGFTLTTDTSDPDPDPDPIPDPDPVPDPDPEPDPVQTPYPGPNAPLLASGGVLTVDASDYDEGGQGISYFDRTEGIVSSSNATDGGRTGSDVDQTINGDIGWVQDGEWLEYTINIQNAGVYDLDLLMGTRNSGRSVTVSFTHDDGTSAYLTTGSIATTNTGSYSNFVNNSADGILLEAGVQTVRVLFSGNDQDIRSFRLTAVDRPINANDDSFEVLLDGSSSDLNVIDNDGGIGLTVTGVAGGTVGSAFDVTTTGGYTVSVTLNANGALSVDAPSDLLDADSLSFTYTLRDVTGATQTADVTVDLRPVSVSDPISFAGDTRGVVVDLAADTATQVGRMLLLGDSITNGVPVPGGYRYPLWNDLVYDSDLWVDFTGDLSSNNGTLLFDTDHRGSNGITAASVHDRIADLATRSDYDTALILLGTNDVGRIATAVDDVPGHLLAIMRELTDVNGDVQIFLATYTPHVDSDHQADLDALIAVFPDLIATARAEGINVSLVDMSDVTTGMLADSVHPNSTGYEVMSDAWLAALLDRAGLDGGTVNGGEVVRIGRDVTQVTGSEEGDRLSGDNRDNILNGRNGLDLLEGRGGDDELRGGGDRDVFLFRGSFGDDRITDFDAGAGGDAIALAGLGVGSFSAVQSLLSNVTGGTLLRIDADRSVLLEGVSVSELVADNFLFT